MHGRLLAAVAHPDVAILVLQQGLRAHVAMAEAQRVDTLQQHHGRCGELHALHQARIRKCWPQGTDGARGG